MHASKRGFLKLSGAAVALLAGIPALAQGAGTLGDVNILNVALGLEWEGINAYTLGAQSGLLQKPVLDVAVRFQADHKEHADTLAGAIRKMGGKPVEPKSLAEYAKALRADTLKSQADVLDLAARLELGATNAYLVQDAGARAGRGTPCRRRSDALDGAQQRPWPLAAGRRHAVRRLEVR
jgi:hypothetical protein